MKIKDITFKRYDKKTSDYTKEIHPFAKYIVSDINENNGTWKTIDIKGPKQNFTLCSVAKPLKVCRPGLPTKELPLFYVMSAYSRFHCGFPAVTKIQGATYFALENDELIPYCSSGRGLIRELGR